MKEGVERFVNSWNEFVKTLLELERLWRILIKFKVKYKIDLEDLPDECQKVLSKVNFRSRFTVGIVRFVEFIERFSTFEECFITLKKEEKGEKEVDNGERSNN